MSPEDSALEQRIAEARDDWERATVRYADRQAVTKAFRKFQALVAQRSAEAVRELEELKGIAS